MNNTLIIDGDKKVSVKSLSQRLTYGGLLEGLPTSRINNNIIERAKAEAKGAAGDSAIYIIEPELTTIPYEGKYPFGEPASLPAVICIADLRYGSACRDMRKKFSTLTLIWFQNEYAFPINDEIIEKIRLVPFGKVCNEFGWEDY